jgi:hypothetical protein
VGPEAIIATPVTEPQITQKRWTGSAVETVHIVFLALVFRIQIEEQLIHLQSQLLYYALLLRELLQRKCVIFSRAHVVELLVELAEHCCE